MIFDILVTHETSENKDTIAEKIAKQINLGGFDIVGLDSDKLSIQNFVDSLGTTKYHYLLGLGQYNGKDQETLRLETVCNKKWRNSNLLNLEVTKMSPFIPETNLLKYSAGHGNSYCNLLSLLIVNTYNNINYNFIHIPQNFVWYKVASELNRHLKNLNKPCA